VRTTLQIDDDVLLAARVVARHERKSIGTVISELARKGLKPAAQARRHGDFPVFDVPDDAPRISEETVAAALEDER
jgi:hypothetical protein